MASPRLERGVSNLSSLASRLVSTSRPRRCPPRPAWQRGPTSAGSGPAQPTPHSYTARVERRRGKWSTARRHLLIEETVLGRLEPAHARERRLSLEPTHLADCLKQVSCA
eukprot:scaffold78034_cov23-Tisochrysis_lutea.AAC.1